MKIKEIMVPDAISVGPNESILNVSEIIFKNRFHGVPVVENGKVIGIITDDDFFLKNYDDLFLPAYIKFLKDHRAADNLTGEMKEKVEKLLSAKARDIMTPECLTVSPETETEELMELIKKTKFTTFPVTDREKNILGIVTLSDILGTVRKGSLQMEKAIASRTGSGEIHRLAREVHSAWRDQLMLVSKKRVRTWHGGIFVILLAFFSLAAFFVMNSQNKTACEMEQKDFTAIECQKFSYSQWSECRPDGTQTRTILEKLPPGCEDGQPEKLVRTCQ